MNDGLMERLARALSTALGDDYNLAFESKQDWITARGGKPFRDVNMPYKGDYTEAVKAILSLKWTQVNLETRRINFAKGEKTNKRRAHIPIPNQLMTFLRLAHKRRSSDIGPVVHDKGSPIKDIGDSRGG